MEEKNWCVYRHTFPNGKVYIGISCRSKDRWANGMGYADNKPMFHDIVRYGWDNIKHEILYDGLTKSAAQTKERVLISSFGKSGRECTYNRVYADYEKPEPPKWFDSEVTRESIRNHMEDFREFDETWISIYIKLFCADFWYYNLEPDSIKLDLFVTLKNDNIQLWKASMKYPKTHMTFKEVYDWLKSTPGIEITKESERPIDDNMLRIIHLQGGTLNGKTQITEKATERRKAVVRPDDGRNVSAGHGCTQRHTAQEAEKGHELPG